jgi:hypothetical protein
MNFQGGDECVHARRGGVGGWRRACGRMVMLLRWCRSAVMARSRRAYAAAAALVL